MSNSQKFPPVLTKTDFVRRFLKNEFGNRGPNWKTLDEFNAADYKGLVHIRNKQPGGPTYYNVEVSNVVKLWNKLGATERTHYLAGMAPTDQTVIQGEVQLSPQGIYLLYSTVVATMREALRQETLVATGLLSSALLQHHLCPNSYDWLMTLLERYNGHVVEFSTYQYPWGTIPGFNTVFWEVRNY